MKISHLLANTLRQIEEKEYSAGWVLLIRAGYIRMDDNGNVQLMHLGLQLLEKIINRFQRIYQDHQVTPLQLGDTTEYPWTLLSGFLQREITSYRQMPAYIFSIRNLRKGEIILYCPSETAFEEINSSLAEQIKEWALQHLPNMEHVSAKLPFPDSKSSYSLVFPFENGSFSYWECTESKRKEGSLLARPQIVTESSEEAIPVLEKVYTPASKSIEELCELLNIRASQTAKVVFYTAEFIEWKQAKLLIAVIRGDLKVQEGALQAVAGVDKLRVATEAEIRAVGCEPGFASPIGIDLESSWVVIDDSILTAGGLVAGANEVDYHWLNCKVNRDFTYHKNGSFAMVNEGDVSPYGGVWKSKSGFELVQINHLGKRFPEQVVETFMSDAGKPTEPVLGHIQVDFVNVMECISETYRDQHGLMFPLDFAPYSCMLISLADSPQTIEAADRLYTELIEAGVEVLYDDRHKKTAGPGIKFKDADLRGIPIRITISKRTLTSNEAELKLRKQETKKMIGIDRLVETLKEIVISKHL